MRAPAKAAQMPGTALMADSDFLNSSFQCKSEIWTEIAITAEANRIKQRLQMKIVRFTFESDLLADEPADKKRWKRFSVMFGLTSNVSTVSAGFSEIGTVLIQGYNSKLNAFIV